MNAFLESGVPVSVLSEKCFRKLFGHFGLCDQGVIKFTSADGVNVAYVGYITCSIIIGNT